MHHTMFCGSDKQAYKAQHVNAPWKADKVHLRRLYFKEPWLRYTDADRATSPTTPGQIEGKLFGIFSSPESLAHAELL